MLTRIVKMTFRPDATQQFLLLFGENRESIASFPGCRSLRLLHDKNSPEIFFTVSEWESEQQLNLYRQSALFESIWGQTKVLFADKPEAWSAEVCA